MNPLFLAFRDALIPLYGQGEARAVAFLVFEDAFGVSRTDIYVDKVRQFSEDECTRLHNICKQLLAGHKGSYNSYLRQSVYARYLRNGKAGIRRGAVEH